MYHTRRWYLYRFTKSLADSASVDRLSRAAVAVAVMTPTNALTRPLHQCTIASDRLLHHCNEGTFAQPSYPWIQRVYGVITSEYEFLIWRRQQNWDPFRKSCDVRYDHFIRKLLD